MTTMVIIKEDNMVGIGGVFYNIDCSKLPNNFHALEFFTDTNSGEVQWTGIPRPQNTPITSVKEYQQYFDAWKKKDEERIIQEELAASANTSQ